MKIGPPHGELELKIWEKESTNGQKIVEIGQFPFQLGQNDESKIFLFLNCLPMLRTDPSSISTGKYEFVWGVPYQGSPSKMQFSRIFALFNPFEAIFELAPEVKIDAE